MLSPGLSELLQKHLWSFSSENVRCREKKNDFFFFLIFLTGILSYKAPRNKKTAATPPNLSLLPALSHLSSHNGFVSCPERTPLRAHTTPITYSGCQMATFKDVSFQHHLLLLRILGSHFETRARHSSVPRRFNAWQCNRELSRAVWLLEQGENINLNISKGKN